MRKSEKGQSAIELAAGIIVIIPIVLFGIDVATLFWAQSINTQVCRDAARAASNGPPSAVMTNSPQQRAELVVHRMQKTKGAIRFKPEVIVSEKIRPPIPTQPFGGPVDGEVTVQTTVDVAPPFIVKNVVPKGLISITASQTFPYTWVMDNAATIAKRSLDAGLNPTGGNPLAPGGPGNTGQGGGPAAGGLPVAAGDGTFGIGKVGDGGPIGSLGGGPLGPGPGPGGEIMPNPQ